MTETNLNEMVEDGSENTEQVDVNVEASGDLQNDSLADFVDITQTEGDNVNEENATDTTPAPANTPAPRLTFAERAVDMGLTILDEGTYVYEDDFSKIAYKVLKTLEGSDIVGDLVIPDLGIFTSGLEADAEWGYHKSISDSYKFLGNATLINQIKESILAVGNADLEETRFMSGNLCEIRHEIIVKNGHDIPEIGSVFPMLNIKNTYNGSGAAAITFGMSIAAADGVTSSISDEVFGQIKQIHLEGANAELTAKFGDFITIFDDNIQDVVASNFANEVTPEEMMSLLKRIQTKAGKQRSVAFSKEISYEEGQAINMNHWQLFLALTRFTSVERNINQKKAMESVVESVLVLPAEMISSLKAINGR